MPRLHCLWVSLISLTLLRVISGSTIVILCRPTYLMLRHPAVVWTVNGPKTLTGTWIILLLGTVLLLIPIILQWLWYKKPKNIVLGMTKSMPVTLHRVMHWVSIILVVLIRSRVLSLLMIRTIQLLLIWVVCSIATMIAICLPVRSVAMVMQASEPRILGVTLVR